MSRIIILLQVANIVMTLSLIGAVSDLAEVLKIRGITVTAFSEPADDDITIPVAPALRGALQCDEFSVEAHTR